jgi:hypothetical protein
MDVVGWYMIVGLNCLCVGFLIGLFWHGHREKIRTGVRYEGSIVINPPSKHPIYPPGTKIRVW